MTSPQVRELARRLRAMVAEAERITDEPDSEGRKQYPRGFGYMCGSVEALALQLEAEGLAGMKPAPKTGGTTGGTR